MKEKKVKIINSWDLLLKNKPSFWDGLVNKKM
jgi:hypothetical protein